VKELMARITSRPDVCGGRLVVQSRMCTPARSHCSLMLKKLLRSIQVRLSVMATDQTFFKPCQLHPEPADLLVQFFLQFFPARSRWLQPAEKISGSCSNACRFHCAT
jgi:hypothetical protein